MNRKKEYIKNTFLLAIGRFSTQLVSFLCIPIHTRYLLTEDYGRIDLYQTLISFFVPIISLRLDIAAYRFLSEHCSNSEKRQKYINAIYSLLLLTIITSVLIAILIKIFVKIQYFEFVIANLVAMSIATVLQHALRGIRLNKNYSICSLISSSILFISTIIMIIGLHMDGRSILIASILSSIATIVYSTLYLKPKINHHSFINKTESKELLAYSSPMILDATSWWIVSVSDRAIISFFLGVAANGIYSVSCKISNILNSLFIIFNLSWQEAIMNHKDDKDGGVYLSSLGNNIIKLFLSISVITIAMLPLLFDIVIGREYNEAYNYMPILVYANIFSIISTLTGSILIISKKTKIVARTTLVSALINTIINICFIKSIGLFAASVSTGIAYLVISIYRYIECRKIIDFKLDIKSLAAYTALFLSVSGVYYINNSILSIGAAALVLPVFAVLNRSLIIGVIKKRRDNKPSMTK